MAAQYLGFVLGAGADDPGLIILAEVEPRQMAAGEQLLDAEAAECRDVFQAVANLQQLLGLTRRQFSPPHAHGLEKVRFPPVELLDPDYQQRACERPNSPDVLAR